MSDTQATTADPSGQLMNFARGAKLAALLFFFLPWTTVSCAGQKLVSVSGYNMATGIVSLSNPMTGAATTQHGSPQWGITVAAALIILGLIGTFLLARRVGALAAIATSAIAAAAMCYTVFLSLPGELKKSLKEAGATKDLGAPSADLSGPFQQSMENMIRFNTEVGFWLSLAALLAVIVLCFLVVQRTTPAAAAGSDVPGG